MRHEEIEQQQESNFISGTQPELELAPWKTKLASIIFAQSRGNLENLGPNAPPRPFRAMSHEARTENAMN